MKTGIIIGLCSVLILTMSCGKQGSSDGEKQFTNINDTKTKNEGNRPLNKNIHDLSVKTMDGEDKKLSDYKGKVLLIVNVASKCGYTSQYEGLENIYQKYSSKGFEVLGFPCNDFGEQEPGTNEEIRTFCETKYNVTFPLFDKVTILGNERDPLYERLTNNSEPPGEVSWNFEKFLIDKNGDIAGRYKSRVKPESEEMIQAIEHELGK